MVARRTRSEEGQGRATGQLLGITTGPGTSATVQNLEFVWDLAGNLLERKDLFGGTGTDPDGHHEVFTYDSLHRLASVTTHPNVAGAPSRVQDMAYDTIGNILAKGADYTGYKEMRGKEMRGHPPHFDCIPILT